MTIWSDLVGLGKGTLTLGIGGVRLKNSSGNLALRNAADTADAVLLPQSGGVPTGAMFSFPCTTAPTGYHELDGSLLSRTTYAALYAFAAASGNIVSEASWQDGNFSYGDGSTTFRIPDRRGNFGRGWDHSRGVDTGRAIGTLQTDDFKSHTHGVSYYSSFALGGGGGAMQSGSTSQYTNATGGTETRPRNVSELVCIKL